MKIKLFTDSDLDGISCGIIAGLVFGTDNVDVVHCTPKDIDSKLYKFNETGEYHQFNKVFITDLVISENTAKSINSIDSIKFKLFDHHRSNFVNSKFVWANVYEKYNDRKTCGTELFWLHLKEYYCINNDNINIPKIDKYVEYVRLWDTWDWVKSGDNGIYAKRINTLMNIYSKSKFCEQTIERLIGFDNDEILSDIDNLVINIEENRKKRYINQKMPNVRVSTYNDMKFAYVFAENYISELGNYICKNITGISFAVIINIDTMVVSLRALDGTDIDLASIARGLSSQGGGHPLSAGFTMHESIPINVMQMIFNISYDEVEE